MKRLIRSNTATLRSLPTSYLADAIRDLWNGPEESIPTCQKEYIEYFNNKGIDISDEEQWDRAWDEACGPEPEEEVLKLGGREFYDRHDASEWLIEKTQEYGNTYFFPDNDRYVLNQLIEKFGNTYFWNR